MTIVRRFSAGGTIELQPGDSLPETSVTVLSGAGQKLVRAFFGGAKQGLKVVQKLCWLGPSLENTSELLVSVGLLLRLACGRLGI